MSNGATWAGWIGLDNKHSLNLGSKASVQTQPTQPSTRLSVTQALPDSVSMSLPELCLSPRKIKGNWSPPQFLFYKEHKILFSSHL